MTLKIDTQEQLNKIRIEGELTIYVAAEYLEQIREAFLADKDIEFDLEQVDEIDTSGVQILAAMARQVRDNGADVRFVSLSDEVDEALQNCRLMQALGCAGEEAA